MKLVVPSLPFTFFHGNYKLQMLKCKSKQSALCVRFYKLRNHSTTKLMVLLGQCEFKLSFFKFMKLTSHRCFISDRYAYLNNLFLFNVFLSTISNIMETQFQIQYDFFFHYRNDPCFRSQISSGACGLMCGTKRSRYVMYGELLCTQLRTCYVLYAIYELEIVITRTAPAFHNLLMVMRCVFDINTVHTTVEKLTFQAFY